MKLKNIIAIVLVLCSCFTFKVADTYALNFNFENRVFAESDVEGASGGGKTYTEGKDDFSHTCRDFAKTIRIGGYVLLVAKVILPIIIIIKASMDFLPVITAGNPDELKKKLKKMLITVLAAMSIFFIPTIVNVFISIVTNPYDSHDANICRACVLEPMGEICLYNSSYNENNK